MNAFPSWIQRIPEMIETLTLGGAERIDWLPPTPALTHSDEPIRNSISNACWALSQLPSR